MDLAAYVSNDGTPRHPACIACNAAKRKCSKQLPACRRCRTLKQPCAYRFRQIVQANTPPSSSQTDVASNASPQSSRSSWEARPAIGIVSSQAAAEAGPSETPWFLAPSSWAIDHERIGENNRITYPQSGVEYFLDAQRSWIDLWTRENGCPLIHPKLYGTDLPGPLRTALAAWHTYRGAETAVSKSIALQLATDWSQSLVDQQSMSGGVGTTEQDMLTLLGRTQALHIFQVIALFDGDIRARARAETLLPVLPEWSDMLVQRARSLVSSPQRLLQDGELLNEPQIRHLRSDGSATSDWRAWILSETIRRTWVAATLTTCAFYLTKDGFALCPGSMSFTGRAGLWDASNPRDWLDGFQGAESTVPVAVTCRRLDQLYEIARPGDVDEFTQALLAYGRGRETLESWLSMA